MTCIFCDILDGKREAHIVYEDEHHIAFLDKYPIDDGHTLVIPKKHYERITDMDSNDVGKIFSLVPKIAKAVLDGACADAFSLAQNNGKAAKQIILMCIFTLFLDTITKELCGQNVKFQLMMFYQN